MIYIFVSDLVWRMQLMLINLICHTKSESFIFVYQKSLKLMFKTVFFSTKSRFEFVFQCCKFTKVICVKKVFTTCAILLYILYIVLSCKWFSCQNKILIKSKGFINPRYILFKSVNIRKNFFFKANEIFFFQFCDCP